MFSRSGDAPCAPRSINSAFLAVQELAVARSGQSSDPSAGRQAMDAVFGDDSFRWGYLTKQSAAWAVLGVNFGSKFQPSDLAKDGDKMFVVAYPSFNPRGE